MKTKLTVIGCLIVAVILSFGYEYGVAEPDSKAPAPDVSNEASGATSGLPKIGVVSIRKIFQDCKRNAKYREEAVAEQDRLIAELQQLSKQIEAEEVGLKTFKAGSSDYLAHMKELMEKQAKLEAQRNFYQQQMELKDQRWTEQLYKDILTESRELAEEKGLDLVFGKDEPEFPSPSANELMLTIRTHKLLYSGNCLDITEEVMARIDNEN